jgi:N-acetylmuramoyl-L-alanine amidase
LIPGIFPDISFCMSRNRFLAVLLFISSLTCDIGFSEPTNSDVSVNVTALSDRYVLSARSVGSTNACLENRNHLLTFEMESRKLMFDGILVWLNSPLTRCNDNLTVSPADVAAIIEPLLTAGASSAPSNLSFTVVIDPGHGGQDTGAIGQGNIMEKKIVLDIAKRVGKKLKEFNLRVRLTRKKDSTLTLDQRVARAAEWGANMFVSVHVNSASNANASGLETYVLPCPGFASTEGDRSNTNACPGNTFDTSSIMLAWYIHSQMISRVPGMEDRGIRHARFDVLCGAPCPAVLVECGFVSNQADEKKLQTEEYLENISESIAQGILRYTSGTNFPGKPQ